MSENSIGYVSDSVRSHFYGLLNELAEASLVNLPALLKRMYSEDAQWRGSHPLNEARGPEEIAEAIWLPLLSAFNDLERRDEIFIGGQYEKRNYIAAIGHYCGTFKSDWLTIPATGKPVYLRYGEVHQIHDGKIVQSNCLWDILDLMRQAGFWPLPPSTGTEGRWAGPITADGIQLSPGGSDESAQSLAQTLAMQATLGDNNGPEHFSREGLLNMDQKHHWHPKMMWYGPSGVGTTRGLEGFVDYHQLPFRLAFPNRYSSTLWAKDPELKEKLGAGHYVRIGDGKYSLTSGWPSVVSPHDGEYLGCGATGNLVQMRVMDFYHHHEGLIRENWVPIDIIHVLRQMGVDVFQRLHKSR